jgi:MFS family permease
MTQASLPENNRDKLHFLLLNMGHFLDHLFTLIFATVAALALSREWGLGYADLLKYATPGFFAFGLFSLPAGWLADKWSREGMMAVFFIGIGFASIATSFAQTPLQVGIGLFVVGVFAAIYHPVGLAIVVEKWKNTGMRLAVNGVWGNLGVASAALITGYLIDHGGWRIAFVLPGLVSIVVGIGYTIARWPEIANPPVRRMTADTAKLAPDYRRMLIRISAIVFLTSAVSSIIFQSTTFALPKIFDEKLQGIAGTFVTWINAFRTGSNTTSATMIGALAFIVFAVASMAQLVVGSLLDKLGPRTVFMGVAAIQVVFFALMPGLTDWPALIVALGFMIGAFGQIPINDYMVGRMASGDFRARVYGVRYVVSFTALAIALPLIGTIHQRWGFDTLFLVLSACAFIILCAVFLLPGRLPSPPAPAAVRSGPLPAMAKA